jgi:hypothetical protein
MRPNPEKSHFTKAGEKVTAGIGLLQVELGLRKADMGWE